MSRRKKYSRKKSRATSFWYAPAPARDWATILRELIDYCDRGILPKWMESRPEPEINIDWIMNLKLEDFEPIEFDWTLFECLKL